MSTREIRDVARFDAPPGGAESGRESPTGQAAQPAAPAGGGGWRSPFRAQGIVPQGATFLLGPFVFVVMGAFVAGTALYSNVAYGQPLPVAYAKALSRLVTSSLFRQTWSIVIIITLMRVGLEPTARTIRGLFAGDVRSENWERSSTYLILREIYRPVELLLYAGMTAAVAEGVLPTLISVPRAAMHHIMRTILTLCVIVSAALVVFKIKDRALREAAWQFELSG